MRLKFVTAQLFAGAIIASATLVATPVGAGELVYTPINPSFGGNPLNSSHLLGMANAQRTATARDANTGTGTGDGSGGDGGTGTSDSDLFVRQLQGRLLSALASQVTEAIFGENPQDQGLVTFGDTTVEFIRTPTSIRLIITDATGVTEIIVPQLVNTASAPALSAGSATVGDLVSELGASGMSSGLSANSGLSGGALSSGGLN